MSLDLLRWYIAVLALVASTVVNASQLEIYDVTNRTGKNIPSAVIQLILPHASYVAAGRSRIDGSDIRITQCSSSADVPFFLDQSSLNTDSLICWVRVTPLPAASTIALVVSFDVNRKDSKSNGSTVFDLFDDFSSASASAARWALPAGASIANGVLIPSPSTNAAYSPMVLWKGAHTVQDRNAIIEARVRASVSGGGTVSFFGANAAASQAYLIEHDAIGGSTSPDFYRIDAGAASPVVTQGFVWNPNEYVRYRITLHGDSVSMLRTSEQSAARVHLIRQVMPDMLWTWFTLGFSTFRSAAGSFEVDWIHVRPRLDVEPIVKRRESTVRLSPTNGVICDGSPVTLDAPAGWAGYQWSNGSTAKKISVAAPSTLTLTLYDGRGCSVQQGPFHIAAGSAPQGGRDTTFSLCFGRKIYLTANPGFATYQWFIGTGQRQTKVAEGANRVEIDSADIYYCLITNASGCIDTVIYRVNRVYDSSADITTSIGDNQMCSGDTVFLYAQPPLSAYTWYRDDILLPETSGRLRITDPGIYRLQVRIGDSSNACISTTFIEMLQRNRVSVNLLPTLDLCDGDTALLDAGVGFTTYRWSNGQVGQSIKVFTTGAYKVVASVGGACMDSATVNVTVKFAPLIKIRSVDGRTSMCVGERLDLELEQASEAITWSTGETTRRITISAPGTYTATITYQNGCVRTSSITIDNGVMEPVIVALDNQALCAGESTRLTTTLPFDKYVWSTGETADTIVVSSVGTYTVEVTLFECRSSSSIIIDQASPLGPTVDHHDTLAICGANPAFPLRVTNTQIVPRIYQVSIAGAGFSIPSSTYTVPPTSTLAIPIVYNGSQGAGIQTARVSMSDACGWTGQFDIVIDYGSKVLALAMTSAATDGGPVRAGKAMNLALNINNPSDFATPRMADTVRLAMSFDPLQLHVPIATLKVPYGIGEIDDRLGKISAVLTSFAGGSQRELFVMTPEVLTSSSSISSISVDSIHINNPCVQVAVQDTLYEFTILPHGCEVSTISWSEAPKLSVVRADDDGVVVSIDGRGAPSTLTVMDVLGRIYDVVSIAAIPLVVEVRLPISGTCQYFIVATGEGGSSVTRYVPGGH
jgi:hypothetical protein